MSEGLTSQELVYFFALMANSVRLINCMFESVTDLQANLISTANGPWVVTNKVDLSHVRVCLGFHRSSPKRPTGHLNNFCSTVDF